VLVEHGGSVPVVDPSAYVAPTAVLCGNVRVGPDANVLAGPQAHVNGAVVGDACFLATGCALFPGSRLGREAEVRMHGVVYVNSALPDAAVVRIGWVAVGDPASVPG
jgi:carbonic anhydrase/acetyltransferase-like protein (isoleucine patch superfamily)